MTEQLKQEINLYLSGSQDERDVWSWQGIKVLTVGCSFLCILISILIALNCFFQRSQIFYYQQQIAPLKKELALYANALPDFVVRNPQINNLDELYRNRPLTNIEAWKTPYSFSHLFVLLGKLIPDTVWLQQIQLQKQGSKISLDGFSSSEHDLQAFIQKLNGLQILLPLQMTASHVERVRDEKGKREAYQFHLEVSDEKTASVTA